MKGYVKRILSAVMISTLLFSTNVLSSSASMERSEDEIVAEIMAEYKDELENLGIEITKSDKIKGRSSANDLSPEDFEARLREVVEQSIIDTRKAISEYEADGSKWEDIKWIECKQQPSIVGRAQKSFTQSKKLDSSTTAYLEGELMKTEDGTNIVRYRSISNSYTEAVWSIGGGGFTSSSYTYKYLDGDRTCQVTYKGTTEVEGHLISGSKSTEFYASW